MLMQQQPAARRQRQEEEERLRKEAHDGRAAKEYAQSMFEWGATVHAYCENMQKFMEKVASHNGMSATAVPPPPAPPPLPPAYVAASSPNPSLVDQVASHTGMTATAFPSPLAPPPPPAHVASSSPNLSHDNVGTLGSSAQMETPEETLSRIAYGGYRCHVNATSGGGTYSPEDDDEFPLL